VRALQALADHVEHRANVYLEDGVRLRQADREAEQGQGGLDAGVGVGQVQDLQAVVRSARGWVLAACPGGQLAPLGLVALHPWHLLPCGILRLLAVDRGAVC
jgi:hypothetical protein